MPLNLVKTRWRLAKRIEYRLEEKAAGSKEYRAAEMLRLRFWQSVLWLASVPFYLFYTPQQGFERSAQRKPDRTYQESYIVFRHQRRRFRFYLALVVALIILYLILPIIINWLESF